MYILQSCHMVSRPIAPSFSFVNSLISADVLSAAHKHYKNTFSKVSFNIYKLQQKWTWNWKRFSARENQL